MREPYLVRWERTLTSSVIAVATTPNFSVITAAEINGCGHVYGPDGHLLWTRKFDQEVWATACSNDGTYIAYGTANKHISAGAVEIFTFEGTRVSYFSVGGPVWCLSFSEGGNILVASTWVGACHIFILESGHWRPKNKISIPGAGVYGVKCLDEKLVAAVGYNKGVYIFPYDADEGDYREISSDVVGYNLSWSDQAKVLQIACSDGSILQQKVLQNWKETPQKWVPIPNAKKAICGLASTSDFQLTFSGSFDGVLRATTENGVLLWEKDLGAEIWSVAVSPSGKLLVAGCGNGKIITLDNKLASDEMREIHSRARSLERDKSTTRADRYKSALRAMGALGLFAFSARFLARHHIEKRISSKTFGALVEMIYEMCPMEHPEHPEVALELGSICQENGESWDAACYFLRGARNPKFRLKALMRAANSFRKAGHNAAALSCFRRARETVLTNDDLRLIYTLARALEEANDLKAARDHLDIILVQDPDYRDVSTRLRGIKNLAGPFRKQFIDYENIAINLLGPEVPSINIDPVLIPVIEARSRELNIDSAKRWREETVIDELFGNEIFTEKNFVPEIIGYDTNSYIKYDFLLPEDDVKKKLEAINLITIAKRIAPLERSLDIGTATARYPTILKKLGVDAFGVDIEPRAIQYANSKFSGDDRPKLQVGDARALIFGADSFDFVTCMMGTFFHIAAADQMSALKEMHRVVRINGGVAVSVWDLECPHLTFLSMYSEKENELIAHNSKTIEEMRSLFEEAKFREISVCRLSLVPDTISYDLGIEDLSVEGIRRLAEIDRATRVAMPSKHGQMFIISGIK